MKTKSVKLIKSQRNKNKKTKKNAKAKSFLNMRGCYKKQKGGMMPPLNGVTLVGQPWSASTPPGTSTGNHYTLNTYANQPDRLYYNEAWNSPAPPPPLKMSGGRRFRGRNKRKHTRKQKDTRKQKGGLLRSVLFDQMGSDLTNAYKTWQGQDLVVSPLPFKDQIYYGNASENNINSIIMK